MRITKQQVEENRAALVAAAAELFRERGFDAVSVTQIAARAGLTHGAFYSHFPSKAAIIADACMHAVGGAAGMWRATARANPRAPLKAIARGYLAAAHRDLPGTRCTFAALGSELARAPRPVRKAATEALEGQIAVLEDTMPGRTRKTRRKLALETYSRMIGAMVMARAVEDEALSDEFLRAAAEAIAA